MQVAQPGCVRRFRETQDTASASDATRLRRLMAECKACASSPDADNYDADWAQRAGRLLLLFRQSEQPTGSCTAALSLAEQLLQRMHMYAELLSDTRCCCGPLTGKCGGSQKLPTPTLRAAAACACRSGQGDGGDGCPSRCCNRLCMQLQCLDCSGQSMANNKHLLQEEACRHAASRNVRSRE